MRVQPHSTRSTRIRRASIILLPWFGLALFAIVGSGCDGDVQPAAKRPQTRALDQTGVTVDNGENAQRPNQPGIPAKQSGPIIGKRTTDIRNAAVEVNKGGAKTVKPRITAKDYITLQGNAYASIIGQTSVLAIQHAMDLYHASNDRYPKDYNEFMTEIIKANNIALPQLPPYQKYGYDENEHKLVILEYQAIKDEPPPR
jgi:hypothetical protein